MVRVAFVHAHPDDEAIFTGGTMALLVQAGCQVDLVVATGGELGAQIADSDCLATRRQAETLASCQALGVASTAVRFLAFEDSGIKAENPQGLFHRDQAQVANSLLDALAGPVDAIVTYDDHGIYGHPDHIAVHRAGLLASRGHAERFGTTPTIYESTVDREYLHFVETHVVVEAGLGERPVGRGLASTDLGSPTLLIDTAVDVTQAIGAKRAAMACHQSQLPGDAPLFELGQANFAAVYGWEWYRRQGEPGPIEDLAR